MFISSGNRWASTAGDQIIIILITKIKYEVSEVITPSLPCFHSTCFQLKIRDFAECKLVTQSKSLSTVAVYVGEKVEALVTE